jgi:hypothetical protein
MSICIVTNNGNACISTFSFTLILIILVMSTFLYLNKKALSDSKNIEPRIVEPELKIEKEIIVQPKENYLIKKLPLRQYLENRDRSVLYDPIISPERRMNYDQYPYFNNINIPTRGYPDNYQLLGIASRNNDEKIIQLFGRPTFPGSNQWEYYVTIEQNGFRNKIPLDNKKEINDGDDIIVPGLNGNFKTKIYNYNTPRYVPYI